MDGNLAFQQELTAATLRAARRAVEQFGDEGIYSFALYNSGEYRDGFATLSTRSGLAKAAPRYLTNEHFARAWRDLPTAMEQLKWSPGDSPHFLALIDEFAAAGELLDALWAEIPDDDEDFDDEDMDDDYNRLCRFVHDAFVQALHEVRNAGIFDGEVTLNILTGDQSDEERLENAASVNDAATVERLRADLAGYIRVTDFM
jgi:hypothetical protein